MPKRLKVWYEAGLQFSCTQCGNCCSGEPGAVWVTDESIAAMATALEMSVAAFGAEYVRRVGVSRSLLEYQNGDCVFLDRETRGCRIYEVRPVQCRTWPFWDSVVASSASWAASKEDCPGMDRGPSHDRATIEQRVQETRSEKRRS